MRIPKSDVGVTLRQNKSLDNGGRNLGIRRRNWATLAAKTIIAAIETNHRRTRSRGRTQPPLIEHRMESLGTVRTNAANGGPGPVAPRIISDINTSRPVPGIIRARSELVSVLHGTSPS